MRAFIELHKEWNHLTSQLIHQISAIIYAMIILTILSLVHVEELR